MDEKVVQGSFNVRHWLNTKRVLFATIVVLVLIIAGFGWRTVSRHHAQTNAHTAMLAQTQKLLNAKNYELAELKLQEYLATSPSSGYKRDASIQLASAYANSGDLPKALQWYKNTAQTDKTPQLDVVAGMAYTYRALKDKQNAIKYFQQAVGLEQQGSAPDKNAAITTYQYLVKQTGGSI